jgi:DNA-binding response OmpR family regulator
LTQPYALIIEDDPKLGEIYKTALQNSGFATDLDENGDQYRVFLEARQPDLVILDLHLPFASGSDILDEIRARYPARTRVALITADFVKAKTLSDKADHLLVKPVSLASLLKLAETIKGEL